MGVSDGGKVHPVQSLAKEAAPPCNLLAKQHKTSALRSKKALSKYLARRRRYAPVGV